MDASQALTKSEQDRDLCAVCVGNTRTQFGLFQGKELVEQRSEPNDLETLVVQVEGFRQDAPVVIATVNAAISGPLAAQVGGSLTIGTEVPIHLQHSIEDASTLGQDRALNAMAAFERAKQACIVIDAGTAITVDFIDGEGVFHGGAIGPGLRMMLASLHAGTAALPEAELDALAASDPHPFGRDTVDAMQKGVVCSARGLAREMSERIASFYDAYPQIVATGGDARLLFEDDGMVEHIVPELQLLGVKAAVDRALAAPG